MCCLLNVFHDRTGLIVYTHTPECRRGAFVFFLYSLILSSNVHSCVLDVRPVRFLFFLFFLTSCSTQQSFKCYRQS